MRATPLTSAPFVFNQGGRINWERVIEFLTESFDTPALALEQLIRNSRDARAKRVTVRVGRDAHGLYVEVQDDGQGFANEALQHYVAGLAQAIKDGIDTHGQHGIGAKVAARFATGVVIMTKRADDPKTWVMSYTIKDMYRMLEGELSPAEFLRSLSRGERSPIKTTGTIVRWTGLHRKKSQFAVDRLLAAFAELFSAEEAAQIFVEDLTLNGSSPKPVVLPNYDGTRIAHTDYVEGIGTVTVDLTVLAPGVGDGSPVRLWAFQRGPEWLAFVRQFRGDRALSHVLCTDTVGDTGVVGRVYAPELSTFSSPNRKEFVGLDSGEGRKKVTALLNWLAVTVAPRIAEIQQRQRLSQGSGAHTAEIRDALAEMRSNLGNGGEGVDGPQKKRGPGTTGGSPTSWYVTPSTARVACGGGAVFQVALPPEGSTFQWEVDGIGTIRPLGTDTTRAHFTAGKKTGRGEVIVSEIRGGVVVSRKTVHIEVLQRLPLATDPGTMSLVFGEERVIELVHTEGTSGNFQWDHTGGGQLEVAPDGKSAVFTAGTVMAGKFQVIVTEQGGEGQTCTVQILIGAAKGEEPEEDVITIRERRFRITASYMPNQRGELARLVGDEAPVIAINTGHPVFQSARDSGPAFRANFRMALAMRALEALLDDGVAPDEFSREFAKLLAELTTKRAA